MIGLALLVSFGIVFAGRKYQAEVYQKYPVPRSCDPFRDNYGDELEGFAIMDYDANTALEEAGAQPSYAGYLQCFCDWELEKGELADKAYGADDQQICADYSFYAYLALGIGNAITIFIVVVNTILTMIAISLITWVGYDTHSEMLTKITNGVFLA